MVLDPAYGKDVSVANNSDPGTLYLLGSETVEGSIRLILPEGADTAQIQLRGADTWNTTSLEISGGDSLHIDKDMHLEAAADFLKTHNPSGQAPHGTALIPHTPYITTDPGSGTRFAHTPVAGPLITENFVTTPVSETLGTTIGQSYDIQIPQIIKNLTFRTGSVAPVQPVTFTIYKGTNNTGVIISSSSLSPSLFPASSDVVIDLGSSIGFSDLHPKVFIEFKSVIAFSMATDSAGDVVMSAVAQQLQVRDVIYDDMALSVDLSLIFANNLSVIYRNQFPQASPAP
jgi:hypothetical protein